MFSLMTVLSALSTCSLVKDNCNWRRRTTIQQNVFGPRWHQAQGLLKCSGPCSIGVRSEDVAAIAYPCLTWAILYLAYTFVARVQNSLVLLRFCQGFPDVETC